MFLWGGGLTADVKIINIEFLIITWLKMGVGHEQMWGSEV